MFSNGETTVELYKSEGKWMEGSIKGETLYGWGNKKYMGYLTPNDIASYLRSDYGGSWERIMQESYGSNSDFEGTGLIVVGSTQLDTNAIRDMIDETGYYGVFNVRGGYWFFPESEETMDELEHLHNFLNNKKLNLFFIRK